MKQWLLVALCLICFSCTGNRFNVDGTVTAEDGTQIYLVDLNCNDTLAVTAVAGNKFTFSGKLEKLTYAYIGYGRKNAVRFLMEPGNIVVDLDERTVEGTRILAESEAYNHKFYGFDALRNDERKLLMEKKDSISISEFNEEWNRINQKYLNKQAELADSVIGANKDNLFGAFVMEDLANKDSIRFLKRYEEVSDYVRNYSGVQNAYKVICSTNRTAPGTMFTDYTIKGGDPDGTDVKLSDYVGKGKYILVDHWASWCGPCKAEMPYLKRAYEMFKDKNFDIVGIAVSDKRDDTMKALEKLDLPWNQIFEAQGIPKEIYGVKYIPHLILFAPDGTILKRGLRGEQIITELSEILK